MMPGGRLGPYELTGRLGSGGMGEVYRARDTQLKRDVALKMLPPDLALDPDRLARGPVPLDEALGLGRQLADALEYAHERGIVHRDLKPANIKLTPDGEVKVLDFGLAKALVPEAVAAAAVDASPTMTGPAVTRAGAILGTAAYMSPEQARGGAVDRRTDIWAFGAVLFETLTGQVCFGGDTVTDVLAAVMHVDPDWAKLPAEVPPRLRSLLRRCLAKDRKLRLQAIGDARIELEEIAAAAPIEPDTAADASVAQRRARWASLVAALCLLALVAGITIVLSGLWPQPRAVSQRPLRLSIIHTEGNEVGAPAISPDGTTPFWSPDSRNLGFSLAYGCSVRPQTEGP